MAGALSDPRPRRYGFALTPLADAMFQLLVFFMLSSSLAPYALIPLTGGAAAGAAGDAPPTPAPVAAEKAVAWQVSRGQVRVGQTVLALDGLAAAMPDLLADGVTEVLVFPARSASVQDLATVLEQLAFHGVDRVQVIAGSRVDAPATGAAP